MTKKFFKRIVSFFLALAMIFSNMVPIARAQGAESFLYREQGGGIVITGLKDFSLKDLVIPDEIDGKPVVEIEDRAFFQKGINSLVLGDNVVKVGDYAFAGNSISRLEIGLRLKTIGNYAFRDNQLRDLNTKNVENIGISAFANNKLSAINFGQIVDIADEAFVNNDLTSLNIGNNLENLGKGVFSYNDRYVLINTENPNIKTEVVAGGFGHVVNPVTVTVHFIDKDTEEKIISDIVLGRDLTKIDGIILLNEEATYIPPKINGYERLDSLIKYKADSRSYEISAKYKNLKIRPTIELIKNAPVIANGGDGSTAVLLSFVKAKDLDGNDISDRITVEPASIDTSISGTVKLVYKVEDKYGNIATKELAVRVGPDWFDFPIGKGWVLGDFTYDENKVVGFSDQGLTKVETQKELILPHINPNDGQTVIDTVADNDDNRTSFRSKSLISLTDYMSTVDGMEGNIKKIEGISKQSKYDSKGGFSGNQIGSLVLNALEDAGGKAFQSNKLSKLNLPNLKYVRGNAFSTNQILSIEAKDLPKVELIEVLGFGSNKDLTSIEMPALKEAGYVAFYGDKISKIITPNLETVGNGAFLNNAISEVSGEVFPKLKFIDDRGFKGNPLKKISIPTVEKIGSDIFSPSADLVVEDRFDNLRIIGNNALRNLGLKEIHIPNLKSIGSGAFLGNPGSEAYPNGKSNYLVIWSNNHDVPNRENYIINPNQIPDTGTEWVEEDFTWDQDDPNMVTGFTNAGQMKIVAKNYNLELPSRAKIVGPSAFEDWRVLTVKGPNVVELKDSAFYGNQLADINQSFPNLKKIGEWALGKNKLTELNLSYLEDIGNRAFSGNKITKVEIPSAISIGNYAFAGAPVSSLSADKVETIGRNAFSDHSLTELSLPNAIRIGLAAFANPNANSASAANSGYPENNITGYTSKPLNKLDLPKVQIIEDLAFAGNRISNLNIPSVQEVRRRSFDGDGSDRNNLIDSLNLQEVKIIGHRAFGNNKLSQVYFSDKLTTLEPTAFRNNRNQNGLNREVMVFINDYKNPNKLEDGYISSTRQHVINPTRVNIRYVDENNKQISEPFSEYILQEKTYEAINVFGYLVDNKIVKVEDNRSINNIDFVYRDAGYRDKQTKGIEIYQENETDKNTGLKKERYYIGHMMTTNLYIDLTGIDTSYSQGKLKVFYDPKYIDEKSVLIPPSTSIKNWSAKNGVLEINLNTIQGGYQAQIPVNWKFNKYITPDNYRMDLNYLFENAGEVYSVAKTINLEGYYNKPNMLKTSPLNLPGYDYSNLTSASNGPRLMGILTDYQLPGQARNYKVTEALPVRFDFTVANLERYVEAGILTDILPEYIAVNENGEEEVRRAVFEADLNPSWTLDADGKTLRQSNSFGKTLSPGQYFDSLILKFPDLKSGYNVKNEASVRLIPYDKGSKEADMEARDDISIYTGMYAPIVYDGDPRFEKYSIGPRDDGINKYFYDTKEDREKTIPFLLRVSSLASKSDLKHVTITDYGLDERLYYHGISFPRNDHTGGNLNVTVLAMKKTGQTMDPERDTILQEENIQMNEANKLIFDEAIAREIDYLHIILPRDYEVFTALEFNINTKLREPSNPVYDSTGLSNKNIFNNYALMAGDLYQKGSDIKVGERGDLTSPKGKMISKYSAEWDNIKGSYLWGERAEVQVRDFVARMEIEKTQSYPDTTRPVFAGEKGNYNLYLKPNDGQVMNESLEHFEMIDLLPKGLVVEEVVPNLEFMQSGGKYEFIRNYKDSGRNALIFKAEELNPKIYHIATIKTSVDYDTEEGFVTNDLFVTFENEKVEKVGNFEAPPNDTSGRKWLKDSKSFRMQKVKEMVARKYIKKAEDSIWLPTGVITESEAKIDYRLTLINNLDSERTDIDIVDFLPYVGDLSIQEENIGNGIRNARESKFENKFDLSRQVIVPAGYVVKYWNSDSPVNYNRQSADKVISQLNWQDSPAANTRAIRIIGQKGTVIKGGDRLDIIVPMTAPKNDITNDYALTGLKAWNSFVRKDNQTIRFIEPNKVYNELVSPLGSISFTKWGQDELVENTAVQKPIPGAKFEARDSKNNVYYAISDSDGKVLFENLPILESYTIKEISAPEGYRLSKGQILVEYKDFKASYSKDKGFNILVADATTRKEFLNIKPVYGSIKIHKINESGKDLSYIKFNLKGLDSWNSSYNKDFLTNSKGDISIGNLIEGRYLLTEIGLENKTSYKPIDPIEVKIDKNNTLIDFTGEKSLVNKDLQLIINKLGVSADFDLGKDISQLTDHGLEKLDGYSFKIEEVENPTNVITTEETKNGFTLVKGLKLNTLYSLSEVKKDNKIFNHNPNNYRFKINEKAEIVDEKGNIFRQNALNIPNPKKPIKGEVIVEKLDDTGKALEGAVFALYKGENMLVSTVSKLENGRAFARFENLDSGSYTLKEVKAPEGYIKSEVEYNFTIQEDANKLMINDPNYEIRENYILKKFAYSYENKPFTVRVVKGDTIQENISLEVANSLIKANPDLKYRVVGKDLVTVYRPLAGVEFELFEYGVNSKESRGIFQTNGEGIVDFKDFKFSQENNYELIERKTLRGYKLNDTPVDIYLKDESKKSSFTGMIERYKENLPAKGRIIVSKYDEGLNLVLGGVKFALYKEESPERPLSEGITNTYGLLEFRDLEFGRYLLKELEAPEGYSLLSEPISIDLDADNTSVSLVVNNKQKIDISGKKIWMDDNDKAGIRPEKINIILYADGREIERKTVDKDSGWKYEFKDLDKYRNGKEIVYTIEEEDVEGYISKIDGFDIINTIKPPKPPKPDEPPTPGKPPKPDEPPTPNKPPVPDKPTVPKTGDLSRVSYYLLFAFTAVISLILLKVMRRKRG